LRSGFLFSEVIVSICFHPDGIHMVTGMNRGSLRLWNIESGKSYIFKGAHAGAINKIRFSENGKFLASSDNKKFIVKIWKVSI
jgi:WD40 repeat protein